MHFSTRKSASLKELSTYCGWFGIEWNEGEYLHPWTFLFPLFWSIDLFLCSLISAILLLVLRNLSTLTMRASCKFSVFCRWLVAVALWTREFLRKWRETSWVTSSRAMCSGGCFSSGSDFQHYWRKRQAGFPYDAGCSLQPPCASSVVGWYALLPSSSWCVCVWRAWWVGWA